MKTKEVEIATESRAMEIETPLSERIIQCFFSGVPAPKLNRLADSAPRLLEALQDAVEVIKSMDGQDNSCDPSHEEELIEFCAVIAAAEGK